MPSNDLPSPSRSPRARRDLPDPPRPNQAQALTLYLTSIPSDRKELAELKIFLQRILDRKTLGGLRYGAIQKKQRYLTRLQLELTKYVATGNQEHLLNVAVYSFLETYAPEHPDAHLDNTAPSATRHILKGNIA